MATNGAVLTEIDALREAVRVMLGFRSREEAAELFKRKLVREAIANLESALEITRGRHQPDEFALALAIEMELLRQTRGAGHDLEGLFNDPNHRTPPIAEVSDLIARLWSDE